MTEAIAAFETRGANTDVTLGTYSVGAYDSRGQPTEYYSDSTIKMIMEGPEGEYAILGSGSHNQVSIRGYTSSVVHDADKITDSFGNVWKILKAWLVPAGDIAAYYVADMKRDIAGTGGIGGGGNGGVGPGHGVGVTEPIILTPQLLHRINIDTGTVLTPILLNRINIDSAVVLPISTIVSVTASGAVWLIDCAYSRYGTLSPTGFQTVASGSTLAVTSMADTANGYVQNGATPFQLDTTANLGSVASDGTGSYTVPAQTANTWHQLRCYFGKGWGVTASGTTSTGYSIVASGNTKAYTRAESNTKWYLDTVLVYTGTSYTVPVQTDGTYHILNCTT